ncbi:MAG: FliH/SctL family protein [Polyangiales bacterium]
MTRGLRRLGARPDAQPIAAVRARAEGIVAEAMREAETMRAYAAAEASAARAALTVASRAGYARSLQVEASTVIALACEVSRAVLGREATSGEGMLREVTRHAIERVRRARLVVLRVHPDDVEAASRDAASWLPEGMAGVELHVVADAGIERGGVIVESDLGRVDARLDLLCAEVARILDDDRRVV